MLDDVVNLSTFDTAVFVSGIISMGLEILAGRVLAPSFGSSIYTWGSIIGVSLLALSVGYYQGGKRASKATTSEIRAYLLYAALYIVILYFATDLIIDATEALPISSRYAAILPMAILFGPPTYALGFISPYAAELSSKSGKGAASGHFYAVGTVGSLLGAFATTFILIPWLSVKTIYALFAVLSTLPLLAQYRRFSSYIGIGLIILFVTPFSPTSTDATTVVEDQTPYQELRVSDQNSIRTLYLDGHPQSAMNLSDPGQQVFEYTKYFLLPWAVRGQPEDALFIGGGGFTGPKAYARLGVDTSVVELDPRVVDIAKEHFDVTPESMNISMGDGRQHLASSSQSYDVIVIDAYRKDQVPFHLTTKQFYEAVERHLSEDGLVIANVIGVESGPGSSFPRAQYKTIKQVFEEVAYIPTRDTGLAQNIEIVASNQAIALETNGSVGGVNTQGLLQRSISPETDEVPVLTDDYAPISSLLSDQIATQYVRTSGAAPNS